MSTEEREEFLTAKQLAAFLQVSESTVRRLAAKRRIPSVRLTPRIIRFHLDAVREALDVPRYRIRHGEYAERVDVRKCLLSRFSCLNPDPRSSAQILRPIFCFHAAD